jgi:peptidoglycan/LPS O-acetylase OafA/YrhL
MFALAGSLMASSMKRRGTRYAVTSRVRRLLPPLWALGLVAVSAMLWNGWSPSDAAHPLGWLRLAFWIVPVGDPPGSQWGEPFLVVLWYLRTYLWLVLLTPLMYLLYRRRWWFALAAPLALLSGLEFFHGTATTTHSGIWDLAVYGSCWVVGFAHHDGRLAAVRLPVLLTIAGLSALAGMAWLVTHLGPYEGDLNAIPVAEALWALAFVLLAMRWRPNLDWLDRARPVGAAVRFINSRAVTIYLWHYPMISVAEAMLDFLALGNLHHLTLPTIFLVDVGLTVLVTLAIGWVEDIAARRRPALVPILGKVVPETG